jgi:hypothetical protein
MDSHSYLAKLRPQFADKTDPELELMCSASAQWQTFTGCDAHTHRRRGMEKLFPSRVWHEWREERMQSVQYCIQNRIQELMWIGSSNSCKSGDAGDIALSLWWTKPESTTIYVASPYEASTETGVWSYILEQFDEAKTHNPKLHGRIKASENSIVHMDRNPRSFIRVLAFDQVGKLVGKKARDFGSGLLVLILDELPAFTPSAARALLAVMPNLLSVPNLLVIGTGNFALTGDALGIFCDPDERDIPNGYDGFNPDKHFRWRTKRGGLCLRFDGLQSPNVKAGSDIYPFLTTIKYIGKLAAMPGGLRSPDAMRYIRSAPITTLDEFTVTNSERLRAGGAYDEWVWTNDPIIKGAFVDPGFGGDACVLQKFKLGYEQRPSGARRQILALWDEPHVIPVQIGLVDSMGVAITAETQIVLAVKKHCRDLEIPDGNVGFDGSLRAAIVQSFAIHYSTRVQAIDSQGPATDRPVSAAERDKDDKPVPWKQKVDRLVSEFWFAGALLIDSFQLRGLQLSPQAAAQITTRRWTYLGKKKGIQTKLEYKDMLRQQGKPPESPNEADALLGCVEMARRLGLSMEGIVINGGSTQMILDSIRNRGRKVTRAMIENPMSGALPTGTLHGMRRPTRQISSGKLNR